jgi:hypothetical protein
MGTGYPRALAADPLNTNNLYLGIDGDDGEGFMFPVTGEGVGHTQRDNPAHEKYTMLWP